MQIDLEAEIARKETELVKLEAECKKRDDELWHVRHAWKECRTIIAGLKALAKERGK